MTFNLFSICILPASHSIPHQIFSTELGQSRRLCEMILQIPPLIQTSSKPKRFPLDCCVVCSDVFPVSQFPSRSALQKCSVRPQTRMKQGCTLHSPQHNSCRFRRRTKKMDCRFAFRLTCPPKTASPIAILWEAMRAKRDHWGFRALLWTVEGFTSAFCSHGSAAIPISTYPNLHQCLQHQGTKVLPSREIIFVNDFPPVI